MKYPDDFINRIICGECLKVMKTMPDNCIDTIITDPPYGLEFMGKEWDSFSNNTNSALGGQSPANKDNKAFPKRGKPIIGWCKKDREAKYNYQEWTKEWATEALRIAKPGATLLCFGGTRTYHRLACGIEDAGWIIKDCIMWLYGCLSKDTEILTISGWKNHQEMTKKDIVYSFDLKKHKLLKSKINQLYKYQYNGKMINLKNQNTDQLITPNHKVINKKGFREQKVGKRHWYNEIDWVYRDAWQIDSNQYTLPLASVYDGNYSIGGDFAEIIGWVLSEGHYQKDCNAVNIYQSSVNPKKVARIRNILGRASITYSEYQRNREYKGRKYIEYQWYISGEDAEKIKKIIPEKKPTKKLWELKYSEKERLIIGLCEGDGSKNRNGKYSAFYQSDIEFLEWFQVLIHLTGKQGWLNKNKMSCSVHYNDSTQIQGKHNKNKLIDYDDIVWCINTDVGNFMARRNGKIFITGNSGFPKATDISQMLDKDECRKQLEKKLGRKATKEEFKRKWESFRKFQDYKKNIGHVERGDLNIDTQRCKASESPFRSDLEKHLNIDKFPATPEAKLWNGWKSHGLKPAYEPILVAMKPNEGSYANNAMKWGVAGLNIDGGRIGYQSDNDFNKSARFGHSKKISTGHIFNENPPMHAEPNSQGRYPANVILDEEAGAMLDEQSGIKNSHGGGTQNPHSRNNWFGESDNRIIPKGDTGGASRFFYCAKASKSERNRGCEGLEEKTSSERKIMIDRRIYNVEMDKLGKYIKQKREEKGITLKEMNNIFGYVAGCNWWESINKNTQRVISNKDYLKLKDILNLDDRFDYILKTTKEEEKSIVDTPKIKNANHHPTVKPLSLMKYLCTLTITPRRGIVLDPFCGSGTTLMACKETGRKYIGIEIDEEYIEIAKCRLRAIEAVLF